MTWLCWATLASLGLAWPALVYLGLAWRRSGRWRVPPLASRPCVCIGPASIFEGSALRARSSKKGETSVPKGGFGLAFGTPWPPFGRLLGPNWPPGRHQIDKQIKVYGVFKGTEYGDDCQVDITGEFEND